MLVQVGENIRVDLTLSPGEQTQTVTVTGEVPSVNTTDATLGGAVTNQSINDLPLNGRNFERLLQLRPGTVFAVGSGTGTTQTNGRRNANDSLRVEGITEVNSSQGATLLNQVYQGGDSSSTVPIDAIQEFSTEQNPKAEYGFRDGAVINVGIKSGTNSLHGTAYAFGRDAAATDSPNYFTGESPRQPWSSSADRPADVSSKTSSFGLRITKVCAWTWGTWSQPRNRLTWPEQA